MNYLHNFKDIHRHSIAKDPSVTIRNLNLGQMPVSGEWFSAGIHPWQADEAENFIDWLEHVVNYQNVLAVGECGIDKFRGPALNIQTKVFKFQIELSEKVEKPLIIHAVRANAELIELHRLYKPKQEWIIHGFRGGPQLARQFINHGFSLSYGKYFNKESFDITPPLQRYRETDQ